MASAASDKSIAELDVQKAVGVLPLPFAPFPLPFHIVASSFSSFSYRRQ